jgi:FKBP-type peptidyl-prolyl cis-trans isomerase
MNASRYMKSLSLALAALIFSSAALAKGPELKTEEQKFAYIMGLEMGNRFSQQFKQQGLELDMAIVTAGILDSASGKDPKLSKEQIDATLESFGTKMQEKQKAMAAIQEAEMKKAGEKNEKDGKAFLKANAKKDGVKTTKSGLQYKIITAGKGQKPKDIDTVTVNYRGTFIDGKQFDSSYDRGEPATFAVNQVIPGWTEVLQLMPEGSKWEVYIPSELAYGPGGSGPIGPNSTLVFEVELLKANAGSGD